MSAGRSEDLGRYVQELSTGLRARGLMVPGSPVCARPVTWRAAVLGGPRPVVAVATTGADAAACAAQARAARLAGADLVELRADLLTVPPADAPGEGRASQALADSWLRAARAVEEVLHGSGIPVLLTVRTAAEGGGFDADADAYRAALACVIERLGERHRVDAAGGRVTGGSADADAAESAITAIDVELARGELPRLVQMAHRAGLDVVASSHDFAATPDDAELLRRLRAMQDAGADVAKIAVTPSDPSDVERLLGVAARARGELDIPVVVIAMGGAGAVTRLAGGVFGSALTFATAGSAASAPGQLPVARVRTALASLHP
ncbi:type I 3-dehydroquinate dehydratase [Actinomyces ruminicola]|uniref:3-dehydroquinate dehydratase n=1 Tax=Actinomyces ruminicola TaxID=332524 RepID=A0A1G9X8T2_9ACTO|nr:type I 3-dehydroquinate dehydratase [Actinomyces ruminicola]SDM92733.1 3-dehydroquinate dehydratase [Actinomyces ruminicola]